MQLPTLITGGSLQERSQTAKSTAQKTSSALDIHLLDARENYGISDVRQLVSNLHRKPYNSTTASLIILEAQNLTLEAQNSLLKTLEEPPGDALIVLTCSNKENLASTVSSRCQVINLPIEDSLEKSTREGINILSLNNLEQKNKLERMGLEDWQALWHSILLSRLETPLSSHRNTNILKLTRYLKLIGKMLELKKRRASERLLKTLLLHEIPTLNP
jgi:DNA polymerase III delta prime subunit